MGCLNTRAINFEDFLSDIDGQNLDFIRLPKYVRDAGPSKGKTKRKREVKDDDIKNKKQKGDQTKVDNKDKRSRLPCDLPFGKVLTRRIGRALPSQSWITGLKCAIAFMEKGTFLPTAIVHMTRGMKLNRPSGANIYSPSLQNTREMVSKVPE